jgi:integrase
MKKDYPGHIEKRGDSWRWIVQVNRERHTETLHGAKVDVKRYAREKYAKLVRRSERMADGLPGTVKVSDLFNEFEREQLPPLSASTKEVYGGGLKAFRAFFVDGRGDPSVDRVRAADIQRCLLWRRTRNPDGTVRPSPLSARSLQLARAMLHRIFDLAESMEYREGNPVTKATRVPRPDERDPVILSDPEYDRLISECSRDPMLHLFALVLGETGVRGYSEALWLRWEDVRLEDGFIWIASGRAGHRTKTRKGRWIPLTPRLRSALVRHAEAFRWVQYAGEPSPWLFHHRSTWGKNRAGDRVGSYRKRMNQACSRVKLPEGFRPHDLRHRRVTSWLAEGKSPVLVKEAVGHSTLAMTMRYTHLAREHLKALVDEPAEPAKAAR